MIVALWYCRFGCGRVLPYYTEHAASRPVRHCVACGWPVERVSSAQVLRIALERLDATPIH